MTQEHPITPPPELVEQRWNRTQVGGDFAQEFAAFFARWGADQELEACCQWTRESDGYDAALALRADRRPKPPSLKEQALTQVESFACSMETLGMDSDLIRRALESLPD